MLEMFTSTMKILYKDLGIVATSETWFSVFDYLHIM